MGIYYIGAFPPTYGGVTIKNENLYNALSKKIDIEKVDLNLIKKKNIQEIIRLGKALLNTNNKFVIGVSGKNTRKQFTKVLYYLNKKAMRNSIIMIMGGVAARDIADDIEYQKYVSEYRCIYVETYGMKEILNNIEIDNVAIYPNGRFRPDMQQQINSNNKRLKCVFFSLIKPEKGVDFIFQVVNNLPEVDFFFWGHIYERYKERFINECEKYSNVKYMGIFKGNAEETYKELRKYDVLLLPTFHEAEGVPGVLVEAKMAGIVPIVTNINFNSEIVENNVDGIVLKENTTQEFEIAIKLLSKNKKILDTLKKESKKSASKYYIENYIDEIIKELGE